MLRGSREGRAADLNPLTFMPPIALSAAFRFATFLSSCLVTLSRLTAFLGESFDRGAGARAETVAVLSRPDADLVPDLRGMAGEVPDRVAPSRDDIPLATRSLVR